MKQHSASLFPIVLILTYHLGSIQAFVPSALPSLRLRPLAFATEDSPLLLETASRSLVPEPAPTPSIKQHSATAISRNTPSLWSHAASWVTNFGQQAWQTVTSVWNQPKQWRPSAKFRTILGVSAATFLAGLWFSPLQQKLWTLIQTWWMHRGWQGVAALGRSVAYGWALFVAYPRVLDRRAAEKQRQKTETKLNSQRRYLQSLAAELDRLRHEYTTVSREIRAFRREIIALKAAGGIQEDVQQAIDVEMAQLVQLRADIQAALQAARTKWAATRAQSPPQLWEEIVDPTLLFPQE